MIEKIISGGRSGAEQAALDASIKLGIAYGGWIPKEGHGTIRPDAARYNLLEMPTANQTEAQKKNIRESDGTLILSHGTLSSKLENTAKSTRRYSTPLLQVDLNNTSAFNAASLINDWIIDNDLTTLHVTGPSENEDEKIYPSTLDILQAVYFLNLTETSMNQPVGTAEKENLDTSNMPMVIIKLMWRRLRDTHRLRVVK